jgi:WD40 repeat protein
MASATAVNIWDVQTGIVLQTLMADDLAEMKSVSWSPDGSLVAVGSSRREELGVWDVESGILQYILGPYAGYSVAWSPDSTRFVTEYRNVYDAQSGDLLFHLDSPYFEGCQAYWSPDGSMIATTSCHDADYLTIWSADDGTLLDTYWGGHAAAWSPDSTRIASDGQVRAISTGLPVTIIPEMGGDIAWYPEGEWIASTGDGQHIVLLDASTGEILTTWESADCTTIRSFAWSPDGNWFAVSCSQPDTSISNRLMVWERVP